jgi:hypothetical protein
MKTNTMILLGVLGTLLVGAMMLFSYRNTEVALRNRFTTEVQNVEASHDNMWKILAQKAQVSSEYRQSFEKVFPQIIEGRYSGEKGNSLMKFIQESNPTFDTSLYRDVMQSIEAERRSFLGAQRQAMDVAREYNTYTQQMPATLFLGSPQPLVYKVISSSRSQQAMETGTDDDTDLFKK